MPITAGGQIMLKERMKGSLPYPPQNAVLIIYDFLVEENNGRKHREGWIYDLHTQEFKYPMDKLNQNPIFWIGTKTNGEINQIEGTNIFWKIEKEMFVFWLE